MTGMTDPRDFIATVPLAQDPRLRTDRVPTEFETLLRRSARDGAAGRPAAEAAFGDGLRAAVNGGAVLSFVADLTAEEKRDVLFSTQFAQRAASARHDRFAATDEWYRTFAEVMERLGWVGESFAFTQRASGSGALRMDKSALDVIATIATGNQLAILVKALETMKGLAEDSGAIRVFELQAMAELSGNYQLGTVQRAQNGALAMAMGAFRFHTTDRRRRALFWDWGAEEIVFWAAAQKMTLNAELHAPLRDTVAERLAADAADYVVDIPIA